MLILEARKWHKPVLPVDLEFDVVRRLLMFMAKRAYVPVFVATIDLDDMGTIGCDIGAPYGGTQGLPVQSLLAHPIM